MGHLFCAQRRSFVVCDRNMPDFEAGRAVNVDEGAVGVEAEMLIGEKANDRRHAGRLRGLEPHLDLSAADGGRTPAIVAGTSRTVEFARYNFGNHRWTLSGPTWPCGRTQGVIKEEKLRVERPAQAAACKP